MTAAGRPPVEDTADAGAADDTGDAGTAGALGDVGAAALSGVLLVMALLAVVVPLLLSVAGVLTAGDRARVAADAAALAVLAGSPLAGGAGAPDTAAGEAVAGSNGAALVEVDLAGWPVAVTATVAVAPPGPLSSLFAEVHGIAAATLASPETDR